MKLGQKEYADTDRVRPQNPYLERKLRAIRELKAHPRNCEKCGRRRASRLFTKNGIDWAVCGVCNAKNPINRRLALLHELTRDAR
jgi:hypothetical protein